ncbi:DUF418 domain-containing protein [Corynebacterium sp. 35RC1]|nr:DUF418 domain-containing protein [Corynebacterium sp. 35RC1]
MAQTLRERMGSSTRIIGLDVARALAVIGMIAAHLAPSTGAVYALTNGFPSAMFAVLAGVSTALMMAKGNAAGGTELALARHRLLIRGVVILLLGMLLAAVQTFIAVVLSSIALIILLLGPVTRWRTRNVIVLGLALWVGGAAILGISNASEWYPSGLLGPYPPFAWLTYGVVGILLYRFLVAPASASAAVGNARSLWRESLTALAGLGVLGLMLWWRVQEDSGELGEGSTMLEAPAVPGALTFPTDTLAGAPDLSWRSLLAADASAHSGGLIDVASASAVSIGVIALCLLLARIPWAQIFLFPLRSVGQMALSSYVFHVLSIAAITFLLGLFGWVAIDPIDASIAEADKSVSSTNVDELGGMPWGEYQDLVEQSEGWESLWDAESEYYQEHSAGIFSDEDRKVDGTMSTLADWFGFGATVLFLLIACPVWMLFFPRGPLEQFVRWVSLKGTGVGEIHKASHHTSNHT